jgi:hypothetical protein
MRIFRIMPTNPEQQALDSWALIAREEDGREVTLQTYPTAEDAEAAKILLEQSERDILA